MTATPKLIIVGHPEDQIALGIKAIRDWYGKSELRDVILVDDKNNGIEIVNIDDLHNVVEEGKLLPFVEGTLTEYAKRLEADIQPKIVTDFTTGKAKSYTRHSRRAKNYNFKKAKAKRRAQSNSRKHQRK